MSEASHDAEIVALLTRHQPEIRFYVASLLPGDPSAADVSQHANSTIWRKRAEFELGTNFRAWAFSIARYEVLAHRKRQARDSRLVFSDEMVEIFAEELPEPAHAMDRRQSALGPCLEKLRPADRDLIMHRYFERTKLRAYAEKVGRSAGGLKVTLSRIRKALAECIEHTLAREEADA